MRETCQWAYDAEDTVGMPAHRIPLRQHVRRHNEMPLLASRRINSCGVDRGLEQVKSVERVDKHVQRARRGDSPVTPVSIEDEAYMD